MPSTPAVRTIGVAERRARLATRHRLVPSRRTGSAVEVARDLVALHATYPASVHLAPTARLRAPTVAAVGRAVYDDRDLGRIPGLRRTMVVLPIDLAPVVQDGDVVTPRLEDAAPGAAGAVASEARGLTTSVGPARVTPWFRTPLASDLTGAP